MRWSGAFRLHEYKHFRDELDGREGVYEFGYVRKEYFYPKYVGKTVNLYKRFQQYNNPNVCHNEEIARRLASEVRKIWAHYIRVEDAAYSESRLQSVFKIGEVGLYEWNRRIEGNYRARVAQR